jgi:hypothetical protein
MVLGSSVAEHRKEPMQLSPKAIRFIIEALEHSQAHHEERLRDEHVTEEEAADPTNDYQFLEALKTGLKQNLDELICKSSSPTKVGWKMPSPFRMPTGSPSWEGESFELPYRKHR